MSLLSKAIKGVGKVASGGIGGAVLRSIPGVGTIAAGALSLAKKGKPGVRVGAPPKIGDFGGILNPAQVGLANAALGIAQRGYQAGFGCPKGYHMAKDGHGCVRNRRMNPANGRAIRRAASRLKSAERMFRKVLTVQGKPTGKIKPKGKR